MFKQVVTEQYPEEKKPDRAALPRPAPLNRHPDGLEKCIGCELCAWACPADAIYVEGADNTDEARFSPGERYGRVYQINYLRCIFCGLCIEACPTRALTMTNEFELADDNRETLIFEKVDLLAPLLPGMERAAAPDAARARTTQDYYRAGHPAPAAGAASAATPRAAPSTTEDGARDRRGSCAPRHRSTGARRGVAFWVLAPARGARRPRAGLRPQGCALRACLALTMSAWRPLHRAGAPFLGIVQVVVYTGAVMMLFLFVLMLVGVDASDSLVETIRGQRVAALLAGPRLRGAARRGDRLGAVTDDADSGSTPATPTATSQAIAPAALQHYVFAFEATSALLITAAVGAMVLTHREQRRAPRPTQRELSERRFARPAAHPPLPGPGVYARHNAVDTPALLPDGSTGRGVGAAGRCRERAADQAGRRRRARRGAECRPDRRSCRSEGGGPTVNPTHYLVLVGAAVHDRRAGVLVRRNAIVVFMCVELMLNADQPRVRHVRPHARQPRRPGHRVLRDGRRRRRGRGRPCDHRDHLPYPPLGLGRRRQPPEVLRGRHDDATSLLIGLRGAAVTRLPWPRRSSLAWLLVALPLAGRGRSCCSAAAAPTGGATCSAPATSLAAFVLGVAIFIDAARPRRRATARSPHLFTWIPVGGFHGRRRAAGRPAVDRASCC